MPYPKANALVLGSKKGIDEGFKDKSLTLEMYSLSLGEKFRTHSTSKAMVATAFVEHDGAPRSSIAPAAAGSSRRSQVGARRGKVYTALPVGGMRLKSCAT